MGRMRSMGGVGRVRSVRGMGRVLRYHFQALIRLSEYELRGQPMIATGLDHARIVFRRNRKARGSD
jgi:hypothetical protein